MTAPAAQSAPATQPAERRRRRPVEVRGQAVLSDLSLVEITVLDFSFDGCTIRTPRQLKPGDAIRLGVPDSAMIAARVRSCANGKAALVFDAESEAGKPERQQRCSERASLVADVTLRRLGRAGYYVRVFDLSPVGCKVEYTERPDVDEWVRIRFEGLQTLTARTCWVEGKRAGLEFEQPIHPAVFDLLVARALPRPDAA